MGVDPVCWTSLSTGLSERELGLLQSRRGWLTINYYRKDSPFLSLEVPPTHTHLLGSKCPPPEERCLSMPETGEKELFIYKLHKLRVMT